MRWLTLDLDGTLADWPFRQVIQPHMRILVEEYPQLRQALSDEYRRRLTSDQPERIFDWGDIHQTVRENLGLEVDFPDIPKLLRQASFTNGMVYSDVLPSLEVFKSQEWQIAVATNGLSKYQQPLVDKLEIPYDLMLAPDITGATKPDAAFWQALPQPITKVVHVGDLLTHDIWGANAASLTAVWLWREMPSSWRDTPIQERLKRGDYAQVIQAVTQHELQEHGFVGSDMPLQQPKPDFILADFRELLEVI